MQVYADRSGRWRFNLALMLEGGIFDIVAQSSDSYATEQDAEHMARIILTHGWEVVDNEAEPISLPSPGRLQKLISGLILFLLLTALLIGGIFSLASCVSMPAIDGAGKIVYSPEGFPKMEYVALWNAATHSKMLAAAKDFDIPSGDYGSSWVEDAGKAAGLLLLAAGIVFAIARDPIKGILAALGGGILYLCTVFLSAMAAAVGSWVTDVVPWIMTAGLLAGIGALVYAGWHYREVITGLVKRFEVQKEKTWSEPDTKDLVKNAQGLAQGWISKARKKILASGERVVCSPTPDGHSLKKKSK